VTVLRSTTAPPDEEAREGVAQLAVRHRGSRARDVLEHGVAVDEQPVAALGQPGDPLRERPRPRVGQRVRPGAGRGDELLEQRRLARPVRADDRDPFGALQHGGPAAHGQLGQAPPRGDRRIGQVDPDRVVVPQRPGGDVDLVPGPRLRVSVA
jgi:hypothetical protein